MSLQAIERLEALLKASHSSQNTQGAPRPPISPSRRASATMPDASQGPSSSSSSTPADQGGAHHRSTAGRSQDVSSPQPSPDAARHPPAWRGSHQREAMASSEPTAAAVAGDAAPGGRGQAGAQGALQGVCERLHAEDAAAGDQDSSLQQAHPRAQSNDPQLSSRPHSQQGRLEQMLEQQRQQITAIEAAVSKLQPLSQSWVADASQHQHIASGGFKWTSEGVGIGVIAGICLGVFAGIAVASHMPRST